MKRILLLSVATLLYGTAGFAAITAEELVTTLQNQGYTNIEIKVGATQIKVEASSGPGTGLIEAIYDIETGAVLKEETSTDDGDDVDPGVSIEQTGDDFLDDDDNDNNDDENDDSDDDSDDDTTTTATAEMRAATTTERPGRAAAIDCRRRPCSPVRADRAGGAGRQKQPWQANSATRVGT